MAGVSLRLALEQILDLLGQRRRAGQLVQQANVRLDGLGIEPIGKVSPHGLRRTFASLRCAVGDDPAFTAEQLGHEDPTFTMRVYVGATKRRQRLSGTELEQFETAVEWAQWARTSDFVPKLSATVASSGNIGERGAA